MKLSDAGTLSPDDVVARIGKLTASRMKDAMSFLKNGTPSQARKDYMRDIVAERLTNIVVPHYVTNAMLHGIEQEPMAKELYSRVTGRAIRPAAFLDHPSIEFCGATPDGFVDREGLIEVKCPNTGTFLDWIMEGEVPDQHRPQMCLQLSVTGKAWVDFVAYDPRMPDGKQLFIRRYVPTDEEMKRVESNAVRFLEETDDLFERVAMVQMV